MPAVSNRQRRYFAKVEHDPKFAKKEGVSKEVAMEFSHTPGKLPERASRATKAARRKK